MIKRAPYLRLADQVQWQHPKVRQGRIDQTRLSIAGAPTEAVPFSFMVMGDTDAGVGTDAGSFSEDSFSAVLAQQLAQRSVGSQLLLHTGDVTYPVGSYQNYLEGFLRPYQSLMATLPGSAAYDEGSIVFNRPFLPVPGNHDYAEPDASLWRRLLRSLCDRLRSLGVDLGHYGGEGGEAYGRTFLDGLKRLSPAQLTAHLSAHYTTLPEQARGDQDGLDHYCLSYQPNQFTRLPNRYYRFRYGGVDFFALDSNGWNSSAESEDFDAQQLSWLESALIESWHTPGTVGRILYLHHSPYTTEATRWQKSETLWVRKHLQGVLDRVAVSVGKAERSSLENSIFYEDKGGLVDLVISGHAHCLEHMKTTDTGHADAYTDWLVCGGSGVDVRRQREAGSDVLEKISKGTRHRTSVVARSMLYAGVYGQRRRKQRFHSFVKIEVHPHRIQKLSVRPYVVRKRADGWQCKSLRPIAMGRRTSPLLQEISKKVS